MSVCQVCVARAGLASDRCQACHDFSGFERGQYSMKALEGLSARGKLAFLLSELAALKEPKGQEDET